MIKENQQIYSKYYTIAYFVVSIVTFSFAIDGLHVLINNKSDFVSAIDDWQIGFINDITIVSNNRDCPNEFYSLVLYNFTGTSSGCYCNNGVLRKGNCLFGGGKSESCSGKNIPPFGRMYFKNFYITNDIALKICVRRIKGYNAINKNAQYNKCLSNERLCGGPYNINGIFDEVNDGSIYYHTCIPVNESCPITDFLIGNQNPNNKSFYFSKQIDSSISLYFSRTTLIDNQQLIPISNFNIWPSAQICLNSPEQMVKDDIMYPLINVNTVSSCSIDFRYTKLYYSNKNKQQSFIDISEYNLYKINVEQSKDNISNILPIFSPRKNKDYSLYKRQFFTPSNQECQDAVLKLIDFKNHSLDSIIDIAVLLMLIGSLIFAAGACIFSGIYRNITLYINNYLNYISNANEDENYIYQPLFQPINSFQWKMIFFSFIQMLIDIAQANLAGSGTKAINLLLDSNCLSSYDIMIMDNQKSVLNKQLSYSIILIISDLLFILYPFFIACYYICCRKQQQQNNVNQEEYFSLSEADKRKVMFIQEQNSQGSILVHQQFSQQQDNEMQSQTIKEKLKNKYNIINDYQLWNAYDTWSFYQFAEYLNQICYFRKQDLWYSNLCVNCNRRCNQDWRLDCEEQCDYTCNCEALDSCQNICCCYYYVQSKQEEKK